MGGLHLHALVFFKSSFDDLLTGVFMQMEFSTQPPLLSPSHSSTSLQTLTKQNASVRAVESEVKENEVTSVLYGIQVMMK